MAIFPNGYGRVCIQSETSNNSTIFTNKGSDSVSIVRNGNVYHSTDLSKFGSSSIKTNNNYLSFVKPENQIEYTLIDFWVYITNNNTYLLNCNDDNYIYINNNNKLTIKWRKATINNDIFIDLNTWNHIYIGYKLDYSADTVWCGTNNSIVGSFYNYDYTICFALNGQVYTSVFNGVLYSCGVESYNNLPLAITNYNIGYINGYYEEIRFDYQSLITSNFVLLYMPYPAMSGIISGIVKYKTEYANRVIRVYDRNTGELLANTNSDNDGIFYIDNMPNTNVYVVCLDDNINEELNALIYDQVVTG